MARPRSTAWFRDHAGREELAAALAGDVAGVLAGSIAKNGHAALALSGGSTPGPFLEALGREPLEWERVTLTLVDERFVPPSSPRSNQGLITRTLLSGPAAAARFVPLYHSVETAEDAALRAADELALIPLDIAILGMGLDGHTASFFPDAENLERLLDPQSADVVLPVHAASAGEPRITLTLARLIGAAALVLHIEGEKKRMLLEEALEPGAGFPITAVFASARRPVRVYFAP